MALCHSGILGQALPDKAPLPPEVGILIEATPKIATVGDPIRIDLDLTMPAGYQVIIPKPETQIEDFAILDFLPGPAVPEAGTPRKLIQPESAQAGKPQHHRARILTAIYKTGKFAFPSIRMTLKTADGKEVAIESPPVNIEIRSVLTNTDRNLRDLKKQAEIAEPRRWILWMIIALAGCILGVIARHLWKKRRNRPVRLSPGQMRDPLDIAEEDLQGLLARGFPDKGMVKRFYVLLSEIVKRILEAAYQIQTAEQTTTEIMESLRRGSSMEPENTKLIESFFLRCDVVKFAKYVPSRIEHETASKDALQILAQARKVVGSRQSAVCSP